MCAKARHSLLYLSFKARLGLEISAFESSKGQRERERERKRKEERKELNEKERR